MQHPITTIKRYRTLRTHVIRSLPIVILMPHSACNCRCVMCDIWKGNQNLKQLGEDDIRELLISFRRLGTRKVLMSGGEALLHPNFFRLCELLKERDIAVSLHSTGLTLKKHAPQIVRWLDDVIVSLDGNEAMHNAVRNIPGAFSKMAEGIAAIKALKPDFRVSCRSVIHRRNFRIWPEIIDSAKSIGLDQVSFLPADVSSEAFNREVLWDASRQHEILLSREELPGMEAVVEALLCDYASDFKSGYIAESPEKIRKIHQYYCAFHGLCDFPFKRCNAPWVSTVIEADGNVRPCFFHPSFGNIRQEKLEDILNSPASVAFRKGLDMDKNETCRKCVCYLNLRPGQGL